MDYFLIRLCFQKIKRKKIIAELHEKFMFFHDFSIPFFLII